MTRGTLLFELGTEELPATTQGAMSEALHDHLIAALNSCGLDFEDSRFFATPRRLAVQIDGLLLEAPDVEREVLGPPIAASRDADGNWTPAAEGFARKQGVPLDLLEAVATPKGERLGLKVTEAGVLAREVLPNLVAEAVAAIPVAKYMRWGRKRCEFLRPVQWLVLLLDETVLPLSLFELEAGRTTRGHRFHHPENVAINHAKNYEKLLFQAKVIADFDTRRSVVANQVETVAEVGTPVIAEDLLDEVTGLVEWPIALAGTFDEAFLDVPQEALISSMKTHQKYFHLVDDSGALLPRFITVANIESKDPAKVIAGNEKVIRPRLSDAAFFFDSDKKTPLADRTDRLNSVVFQQKLGTLADKTTRLVAVTEALADTLGADPQQAARAAQLCKCDLVSEMVLEFPELQGIAGSHYARHDGEADEVAQAIEEHYWPRFAGDKLPQTREAAAVALADRADTLVGIFGIGQHPTGSRDPFALRRAALSVIRIIIDLQSPLSLRELFDLAASQFADGVIAPDSAEVTTHYVLERLRAYYGDQGISIEALRAVTAVGVDAPLTIDARVRALDAIAGSPDAVALAAANKRVANLLAKADSGEATTTDPAALSQEEEKQLYHALEQAEAAVTPLLESADYAGALKVMATLREPVDRFFDAVMVNADDPALKRNRLALLAQLRALFLQVADIAELAS